MKSKQSPPRETKELSTKIDNFLKSKLSLGSDEAKAILKTMVDLDWSTIQMAKRLNVNTGAVSVAMGRHGISKPRTPVESSYSKAQDEIIKEYYDKPKNSLADSVSLRDQMVAAVNKQRAEEKLAPITIRKIRSHVDQFGFNWKWGWPKEGQSMRSKKITVVAEAEKKDCKLKNLYERVKPALKKHGKFRTHHIERLWGKKGKDKKATARGDLVELCARGYLATVYDGETNWYFSNEEGFYMPAQLYKLVPHKFIDRIEELFGKQTNALELNELCGFLFEDPKRGNNFLETLLEHYVNQGWVKHTKNTYRFSEARKVLGQDQMEVQGMLNKLFLEDFRGQTGPKTLKQAALIQERELKKKAVTPYVLQASKDNDMDWTLLWGPSNIGALTAGLKFQDRALELMKHFPPDVKPLHILTGGGVFGEHRWTMNDLRRAEQESLSRYPWQLEVFRDVVERLKAIRKSNKGRVIERLGAKDKYMAEQFALVSMKAMRQMRYHGLQQLLPTMTIDERRAFLTRDHDQHRKFQYTIIQLYGRYIKRELLNENEVYDRTGRRASEVLLIVEAMYYLKKNQKVPNLHRKVIDMKALDMALNPQRHLKEAYQVTHSNIHFQCGDINGVVYNTFDHTTVPRKMDPFLTLEKRVKDLELAGCKRPNLVVGIDPQRFVAQFFPSDDGKPGTLGMTIPALKDLRMMAEGKLQGFYEGVHEDPSWRELTIRREITTPGLVLVRGGNHNCYDLMFIDDRVVEMIEANRGKPEVRKNILHTSDVHVGGLPMTPELAIRFVSYGLYDLGCHVWIRNGDNQHGRNYPASWVEAGKTALIGMDEMGVFDSEAMVKPFMWKEVSPNLEEYVDNNGNHCWNSWGAALGGWQALRAAATTAQRMCEMQKRNVTTTYTGRVEHGKETFQMPLYANTYCNDYAGDGYKVAAIHCVLTKGKDPQFFSINFFEGAADYMKDIFMILHGHQHHLKLVKFGRTYASWAGRMCMESGWEMIRGMRGTWMPFILMLSNKRPPILRIIHRDFLEQYRCKDPFFAPIEAKGGLDVRSHDGRPWVYDSLPLGYSEWIKMKIREIHTSVKI
ncbi:MAG: hypothetical protein Q7R94_02405 [bacterium]|nr:hypothetical protein [bacterium]